MSNKITRLDGKKYKVLPGCNLGFCIDFTGMILDAWYLDHSLESITCAQPPQDINGKKCVGNVTIGVRYLEPVENLDSISSDFKHCKECRRKTEPCKICKHNLDVIQRLESKGRELALKLLEKKDVG